MITGDWRAGPIRCDVAPCWRTIASACRARASSPAARCHCSDCLQASMASPVRPSRWYRAARCPLMIAARNAIAVGDSRGCSGSSTTSSWRRFWWAGGISRSAAASPPSGRRGAIAIGVSPSAENALTHQPSARWAQSAIRASNSSASVCRSSRSGDPETNVNESGETSAGSVPSASRRLVRVSSGPWHWTGCPQTRVVGKLRSAKRRGVRPRCRSR